MSLTGSDNEVAFAIGLLEWWRQVYERADEICAAMPPEAQAEIDREVTIEGLARMVACRPAQVRWMTHQALVITLELLAAGEVSPQVRRCGRRRRSRGT